ncbi:MAG: hypothetical protein AAB554_05525 [Patescibacteria group bacterium]
MNFENPSSKEQPKTLLAALKEEIAAAENELKGHYRKERGDGHDTYKEGKEKSADLLAMRKAAQALEEAGGNAEEAVASLGLQLEDKELVANRDVYERAVALLERRGQGN